MSQKELKNLYGAEIKAYAIAHQMTDPVEERNRCWRLFYADAFSFHLDSLPCVPEDQRVVEAILAAGVPLREQDLKVRSNTRAIAHRSGGFGSRPRGKIGVQRGDFRKSTDQRLL